MNILLINHYAGSPVHGMEYRPYYLAREWAALGHAVTIIAASFSHVRGHQPKSVRPFSAEYIDGITYLWLKTPPYRGNGLGRIVNMTAFVGQLLRFAGEIAEVCRPEVVIASSTYPLDIYPGYRIARKTNARLIFEVHDLWPLSPMELGRMSKWHPFMMLMQHAENFAYRKCHRTVSILPGAKEHMLAHRLSPEKFVCVPNGIDAAGWQSDGDGLPDWYKRDIGRLKSAGKCVIGYAGKHGVSNALDPLMDAARLMRNEPVVFVLVGQGCEKARIGAKVARLGLRNVIFLDSVSKSAIPSLLGAIDVCYLGWCDRPIYRFGIGPNKLLDYMMAAKPVIHSTGAPNDLVAESGCGISVPPEDPEAIAGAITKLMGMSPEEKSAMGLRGKEYVVKHHDYKILARRFLEVMTTPA